MVVARSPGPTLHFGSLEAAQSVDGGPCKDGEGAENAGRNWRRSKDSGPRTPGITLVEPSWKVRHKQSKIPSPAKDANAMQAASSAAPSPNRPSAPNPVSTAS